MEWMEAPPSPKPQEPRAAQEPPLAATSGPVHRKADKAVERQHQHNCLRCLRSIFCLFGGQHIMWQACPPSIHHTYRAFPVYTIYI
jgi:hypothetical protein